MFFKRLVSFFALISLLVGILPPEAAGAAPAAVSSRRIGAVSQGISPETLLNVDGTLRLDGDTSGALDLSGWDIQLDPDRGPRFSRTAAAQTLSMNGPASGHWGDLGGGGPALNGSVYAMVMIGGILYAGGAFTDADNIPEADYLARWDGSSWSAVGGDGFGNGSLNGWVRALATDGTNLYVGGEFGNVMNNGVLLNAADYIAKWDGLNDWSALGTGSAGNGSLTGPVWALAVNGGSVYAGGVFNNINNNGVVLTAADRIARFDGLNWSALGAGSGGDGSLNGTVAAIAFIGSDLYAGGYFTDVNNAGVVVNAADFLAKWNGAVWSAVGAGSGGNGSLSSHVYALAVSGSNLYVGGAFSNVNNNGTELPAADFIAKWDGAAWSALGAGFSGNGSLGYIVNAIAIDGTDVYAAGGIQNVHNGNVSVPEARFAAVFDGSNWQALGNDGAGGGSLDGFGNAILPFEGGVYVGGFFQQVNNQGIVISHAASIAFWDTLDWNALGSPQGAISSEVRAIAVSGTNVYVGGTFQNLRNHGVMIPEADYVARWDGTNWHSLGSNGFGGGPVPSPVLAIAASGSNVYVGGWFYYIYDNAVQIDEAAFIARWNGANWSALGGDGAGGPSLNAAVTAIAVNGTEVYAGGSFADVNNNGTPLPEADYIAKWDGANWSALGHNGSGNGSLTHIVSSIAIQGSNVYAGGQFTDVNNKGTSLTEADYIARWDGLDWHALGHNGAGNGSLNFPVNAVAVSGTNVYAGGFFFDVNNNGTPLWNADYVARWDGASWSGLGDNGAGFGSLNHPVFALAVNGTNLYVGGKFTDVNANGIVLAAADYAARWNGSNWSALGSDAGGDGSIGSPANALVQALGATSSALYAGGYFYNVEDGLFLLPNADHIAAYGLPPQVSQFRSAGGQDGWVLESTETSGAGGTLNSGATTFNLGDSALDQQYRAILSFNTATLPDNAVITKVQLKIRSQAPVGTNPFNTHNGLKVDIRKGAFSGSAVLQLTDFKALSNLDSAGTFGKTPRFNWYTATLTSGAYPFVNRGGLTQFRLRFLRDDNDDRSADYMKFLSGNHASTSVRPLLIVQYYVP